MEPIDIACRRCAAQPEEDCQEWQTSQGGMVAVVGLIHPERVEDAAYISGDRSAPLASEAAFAKAVEASELV